MPENEQTARLRQWLADYDYDNNARAELEEQASASDVFNLDDVRAVLNERDGLLAALKDLSGTGTHDEGCDLEAMWDSKRTVKCTCGLDKLEDAARKIIDKCEGRS
jgi:hypothetical protein